MGFLTVYVEKDYILGKERYLFIVLRTEEYNSGCFQDLGKKNTK